MDKTIDFAAALKEVEQNYSALSLSLTWTDDDDPLAALPPSRALKLLSDPRYQHSPRLLRICLEHALTLNSDDAIDFLFQLLDDGLFIYSSRLYSTLSDILRSVGDKRHVEVMRRCIEIGARPLVKKEKSGYSIRSESFEEHRARVFGKRGVQEIMDMFKKDEFTCTLVQIPQVQIDKIDVYKEEEYVPKFTKSIATVLSEKVTLWPNKLMNEISIDFQSIQFTPVSDKMKLGETSLKLSKLLGEGAYGKTWLVESEIGELALKVVEGLNKWEFYVANLFSSEYFCEYFQMFYDGNNTFYLMEYAGFPLLDIVNKMNAGEVERTELICLKLVGDLINIIKLLQQKSVIFVDFRIENMNFYEDHVKMVDFGLCIDTNLVKSKRYKFNAKSSSSEAKSAELFDFYLEKEFSAEIDLIGMASVLFLIVYGYPLELPCDVISDIYDPAVWLAHIERQKMQRSWMKSSFWMRLFESLLRGEDISEYGEFIEDYIDERMKVSLEKQVQRIMQSRK